MKSQLPTAIEIKELVDFLPILYASEFKAIKERTTENPDSSLYFPYPTYTEPVKRFFTLASKECWLDCQYNPVETKNMLEDEKIVKNASLEELKTMLTYCVQGERFCGGFWASMIESGKIRVLLERLKEIQNDKIKQFISDDKIDRTKLFVEVPIEPKFFYQEQIPSGYEPMSEIYLEGRAFRRLAEGTIPRWVIISGWIVFGGFALPILISVFASATFEFLLSGVFVTIPLLILYRGTIAKFFNKKKY
jgi:hypothetical protein